MNGELRILDIDLGKRLGFAKPVKIRELIKRHLPSLEQMGTVPTVGTVKRGQDATEYYLNRKQAIFITAKSETAEATDITIEIIHRFDAYERGEIAHTSPKPKRIRKPAFDTAFTRCMNVVALLPNVDENQKLLMAARGTHALCGINPLEVMGYTAIPAATQDNYLTPTELGRQVGLSGRRVNQILCEEAHLQVHTPCSSSGSDWSMTEKGLAFGKMFDSTRKGGKGSQQQLKWKPSAIEFLRPFANPPA
ncbi:hypothetical protein [Acetobacter ascendens]|nr:hypothetical protein [Acetobacter ascendens]